MIGPVLKCPKCKRLWDGGILGTGCPYPKCGGVAILTPEQENELKQPYFAFMRELPIIKELPKETTPWWKRLLGLK